MIEETNVFELKFKTADNKTRTVTIKNPKPDLDAASVEATLNAFIATEAFVNDDRQNIFHSAVSGRYVNRKVQEIYTTPTEA
ncbi:MULTISPECIES: DUF2922 domain-containing protein [Aerococcus]|uniref:DUF2922 domain-containing protein n=1 Tax=Aerococcus viridans TaxID=1377 RepID=A0A2N6UGC2_9LACT|nr:MULTISPECIES: DUF2922 domain-containing protein [Aerococcus]OFU53202.1 hypothetical protein HMPREF3116_00500 [Aerococcus sp. HMSC10H05]PMC80554.1 DUF2922 domain-containing protein [Aerococcus viridans]